jgi:hypothetical protein
MTDELVHEPEAEVTDLRSTIMAAVEKQRAPEETEAAPIAEKVEIEPKEAKPAADKPETEAERNERLRDKAGKFATEKNAVKTEHGGGCALPAPASWLVAYRQGRV